MGFVVPEQKTCGARSEVTAPTDDQKAQIRARIKKLNDWGMLLGVLGLGLQAFGRASGRGWLVIVGAAVVVGGLALYARMRGREGWWGALGVFSILGLIALFLLPKRCHHCGATPKGNSCAACGAPAPL